MYSFNDAIYDRIDREVDNLINRDGGANTGCPHCNGLGFTEGFDFVPTPFGSGTVSMSSQELCDCSYWAACRIVIPQIIIEDGIEDPALIRFMSELSEAERRRIFDLDAEVYVEGIGG